jgi:hypothetical protein
VLPLSKNIQNREPAMPDISDLTNKGNDIVTKAVGAADAVVGAARDAVRDNAPRFEKVADLVPDPSEVVDQVTATANELLGLAQDLQRKVIAALTANA